MFSIKTLERSMSYTEYRNLLDKLMLEGKTTGNDQSDDMIHYAKINLQRMQRLEKTIDLNSELKTALHNISGNYTFVVLTEGWCGDAAQNLPLLSFIEKETKHISIKLLLRDEHLDIMDNYLTNGGRAIPKLICLDSTSLKELFNWGPRPEDAQKIVSEGKKQGIPKEQWSNQLHLWYAKDKTKSFQNELLRLISLHLT